MSEREQRIAELLPLVANVARSVVRTYRCAEYADVYQDGCLGMLRAVDAFDASRGVPLRTYARPAIFGAVLNGIRARDPLSENARSVLREAERERQRISSERGEAPSLPDLTARVRGLYAAMLMAHRADTVSLDAPLPPGQRIAPDWSDDPAVASALRDEAREIAAAVESLSERQRAVVLLHYFDGRTKQSVSEQLGVSAQRVSQLHAAALANMRRRLAAR